MAKIDYPAVIDPPRDVIERLEELDPELTCFYIGRDLWAVGAVRPNKNRYVAGARAVKNERMRPPDRRRASRVRVGKLRMKGYAHIALYTTEELWNGYLLLDMRKRHWRFTNQADETFEDRLDDMEGKDEKRAQLAEALDYIQTEGADHHRRSTRHSVTGRPFSRVTGGFFS